MERFTQWIGEDEDRRAIPRPDIRSNGHGRCCNKLAEYEDAEKQGLLVRLPCKVGDMVYIPTRNFVSELRITLVSVDTNDMAMYFSWLLNTGIYPNLDGFSGYELGRTRGICRGL